MSMPQKLLAILALVASSVIIMSSILCLAFKMTAYNSYGDQTGWGTTMSTVKTLSYGARGRINVYPKYLLPIVRAPIILSGSFGLVIGLAVTWLIASSLKTKRVPQLNFRQRVALITVLSANALLATISMVYTLVQHGRSAYFDPGYVMTTSAYDKGLFSLEAWACEILRYVPELEGNGLETQCMGERASRGLMVVLCFFCLVLLGLLVWDVQSTQAILAKKKLRESHAWDDYGLPELRV
ncbi:hypothetical protein HJFPF1_02383 [Paramyrothecium foliicola]|nr:hypothetical protein HJFPF1_02383 [Paramyrothecium foliicola]